MKGSELIQVYFRRSPTGSPFNLAYHADEYGFVRRQLVEQLMKAGIIDPVQLPEYDTAPKDFVPVAEVADERPDLSTIAGVQAHFGGDVAAMREYCDKHGIKYGRTKSTKGFYSKIAKANS